MGIVPMEVESSFLSRGYPHYTRAVYVYCDRCGSFDVQRCMSPRQVLMVIGSCTTAAAALILFFRVALSGKAVGTGGCIALFLAVSLSLIVLLSSLSQIPGYYCKKCGDTTTTRSNTLSYPSDQSIVDVPEHLVEKFYLSYWPDECDLGDI